MAYEDGEAAALTLIQATTGWTLNSKNTLSTANDDKNQAATMINSGASYYYVVLEPGPFNSETTGIGQELDETVWQTMISLLVFASPNTKENPARVMSRLRDAIRRKLDQYMVLHNANVSYAKVISGGRIQNFRHNSKGPFMLQEMVLQWDEVTSLTQID